MDYATEWSLEARGTWDSKSQYTIVYPLIRAISTQLEIISTVDDMHMEIGDGVVHNKTSTDFVSGRAGGAPCEPCPVQNRCVFVVRTTLVTDI